MPENPEQRLGDRIRRAREARGLRQADLGVRLGVSGSAVSMWESGRNEPAATMLERLAEALQRPISYFYGVDIYESAAFLEDYERLPHHSRSLVVDFIQLLLQREPPLGKAEGEELVPLATSQNSQVYSGRVLALA